MNKERRKKLESIQQSLETLRSELEAIKDDEQSAYENLPESLQSGDKGDTMQNGLDNLDSAVSSLDEVENLIAEVLA